MSAEKWLPVPGFERLYEASSHGRVRSLDRVIVKKDGSEQLYRGRLLKGSRINGGKKIVVKLGRDGVTHHFTRAQIVAETFIGTISKDEKVIHINGIGTDDRVENLRIGSQKDVVQNSIKLGTHYSANKNHHNRKKTHCSRGHKLQEPNLSQYWLKQGNRYCRACLRTQSHVQRNSEDKVRFKQIADSHYINIMKGL